jgi:RHS repeat-associated protein
MCSSNTKPNGESHRDRNRKTQTLFQKIGHGVAPCRRRGPVTTTTRSGTHDESIDTPLGIANANGTFYYHKDYRGSIVALTDSSEEVVESFTHGNHYGKILSHTKSVETNNPYAYSGRELDTKELYYYRTRYYDPTIQRFISGDFNWYRYVRNDPVGRFAIS